uniref:Putative secreted protein n=1 Tax=Anopheles triannulatus TaxID=58253 RepID=A0A2M4B558_9DIPT
MWYSMRVQAALPLPVPLAGHLWGAACCSVSEQTIAFPFMSSVAIDHSFQIVDKNPPTFVWIALEHGRRETGVWRTIIYVMCLIITSLSSRPVGRKRSEPLYVIAIDLCRTADH